MLLEMHGRHQPLQRPSKQRKLLPSSPTAFWKRKGTTPVFSPGLTPSPAYPLLLPRPEKRRCSPLSSKREGP